MHDFIKTIFYYFSRAISPSLIAAVAGAALLALLYAVRHRQGKDFPKGRAAAFLVLMCYLGGLAAITLLTRTNGDSAIQRHLFRAFREAWNAFTLQIWLNPLLNIGMFVPLGILLPLIARPFRRWYWTLAAGAGTSLVIETLQYILQRGSADVDDLFCNTLGALLGYCLCMMAVCLTEKRPRLAGACAILPALSAAALAGVFLVYQLQPYGNLADAPCFAADTRDVEWVLDCALSDEPGPAGIYWAAPFTKESGEEFALGLAQRQGVDITDPHFDIEYYDNSAFYSDHSTFMVWLDYNDHSYQYNDYRVDSWGEDNRGTASEAELRDYLDGLGVALPETVEFIDEGEGKYTFRAACVEKDGTLIDGELTCLVAKGGAVYQVDNHLAVSTLHGEAAVISQQAAYDRLCRGLFSHGDRFEYTAPETVRVTSCQIRYLIDSKGFRQPVYVFALEGLDPVFVPALA